MTKTKRRYSTLRINYSTGSVPSETVKNFIIEKNLNPVFIYENLKDDMVQKQIAKDTKGLSGIYLILNKISFSYYIGSAATGRLNSRFTSHLIYFTGSKLVKNAVKKNKLDNFSFIVLELFPEIINRENNKELMNLEDFYLKSLLPNYNILTEAGYSFGYKHSEVIRLNMKANYSEERRDQIGNLNKGKIFSPETIESMREAALSRNKITYSEQGQGVLNMKKASRAVLVKEISGIVYGEYPSVVEIAKALDCNARTVHRALSGETKLLKKRWIISYK